jgi:hypothetical protein
LPEALDSAHDVRLLRQHGVAKLLRPLEFVVHHLQHRGRRCQRFDALIPALLADIGFELSAFETLVGGDPTRGLNNFERIGRGHQHLGNQRIGIERDRRHQRVELPGIQQLLGLAGSRGGRARLGWRVASGRNQEHEREGGHDSDHRDPPQLTIGRLWNANGRRAKYYALDRQSKSAYHASKSARSSTGSTPKPDTVPEIQDRIDLWDP